LIITQHPPTSDEWRAAIQPVLDRGGRRVKFQVLTTKHTHAGKIAIPDNGQQKQSRCIFPINVMSIVVSGNLALCCMDYGAKYNFGSILDTPLIELWRGMRDMRKKLAKGIPVTELCKTCLTPKA